MTKPEVERLMDLLARAKAVWTVPDLLNLTKTASSPTQAYNLVLAKSGKRKKALAARWYAVAIKEFGEEMVGACSRFLKYVNYPVQKLTSKFFTFTE